MPEDEAEYWLEVGFAKFCIKKGVTSLGEKHKSMANDDGWPNKECEMFCMEGMRWFSRNWLWINYPTPFDQKYGLYDVENFGLSDHDIEQIKKWRDSHHRIKSRLNSVHFCVKERFYFEIITKIKIGE